MIQHPNSDDQQAVSEQTKTTIEFFREKFADEEETEPVWIDPKGDNANDEREVRS